MAFELEPTVLISLVVGGVTLVVVATHALGGSARRRLDDAAKARAAFAHDHPDVAVSEVLLDAGGRAALLAHDGRLVGAVTCLGDHIVARRLFDHPALRDDPGGVLVLGPQDFGAPALQLEVCDAGQRARWVAMARGDAP